MKRAFFMAVYNIAFMMCAVKLGMAIEHDNALFAADPTYPFSWRIPIWIILTQIVGAAWPAVLYIDAALQKDQNDERA